jgi:hypothetical protein
MLEKLALAITITFSLNLLLGLRSQPVLQPRVTVESTTLSVQSTQRLHEYPFSHNTLQPKAPGS